MKWPTSIATAASGRCSRIARATSASKRSDKPRRFSRPVSGSMRDSAVSRATSRSLRAASVSHDGTDDRGPRSRRRTSGRSCRRTGQQRGAVRRRAIAQHGQRGPARVVEVAGPRARARRRGSPRRRCPAVAIVCAISATPHRREQEQAAGATPVRRTAESARRSGTRRAAGASENGVPPGIAASTVPIAPAARVDRRAAADQHRLGGAADGERKTTTLPCHRQPRPSSDQVRAAGRASAAT